MTEPPESSPTVWRPYLDPIDWLWATWRPRVARPRPAAREFDVKQCTHELAKVSARKGEPWGFDELHLPDAMSPREAGFWFLAVTKAPQDVKPKEFSLWAARQEHTGHVALADIRAGIKAKALFNPDTFLNAVSRLVSPRVFAPLLLDEINRHSNDLMWRGSLFAFHRYVLPYLPDDDLAAIRLELAPQVAAQNWPQQGYASDRPAAFHLASMLGMHRPMLETVERFPDDRWAGKPWALNRNLPQFIVFGLGSAELVLQHGRRLWLPLHHPEYLRAWLAHTGLEALDDVRDAILADQPPDLRGRLFDVLSRVKAPQAVRPMLELKMQPETQGAARAWLNENADIAVAALLPLSAGRGKLAQAAAETLWELKQTGHEPAILAGLDQFTQADAAAGSTARHAIFNRTASLPQFFDDASTPPWLNPPDAAQRPRPLPPWLSPASLPPLVVADRMLTPGQIAMVCAALQRSDLAAPDPLVRMLKQEGERASLDAFAWRLFEIWHSEGGLAPHKWAMHAVGLLGSDGSANKLAEMIRSWPSQGLTARAAIGLECLRAIGTEGALMQLDAMARKLRFRGLRERARRAMDEIAAARGISGEDLEDLVIPDCGLDSLGHRVFDLGSRKVSFALAEGMKPMLQDDVGKVHSGVPRATAADDPRRVEAAKLEWALLKKQLTQVMKVQVDRLKKALVYSRRWRLNAFEQLSSHPLMRHLIRAQLWGLYGLGGSGPERLIAAFRVTEEGDWADADDAPLRRPSEPADGRVGLLHPVHLTDEQRRCWGEVLSDYEIISPVPQLTRSVYLLTPQDRTETDISRFALGVCPGKIVLAVLPNMGWQMGSRQDSTSFQALFKTFPHAGVTAVVQHEQAPGYGDDRVFPRLFFIRGTKPPLAFADYANSIRLDKIDPAIPSEAMRDIAGVIAVGLKEIARR